MKKKIDIKIKDISKQTKPREFFSCDCHGEGIILDDEVEIYVESKIARHSFYFALWEYGQSGTNMSFKERIRWCWKILRKGIPWADAVIMDSGDAEKFAQAILKRIYIARKMMDIYKIKHYAV